MFSGVRTRILDNQIRIHLSIDQTEAKQVKMKKEIRIPQRKIRIPISISLAKDQNSNPQGMDSNLDSKKS